MKKKFFRKRGNWVHKGDFGYVLVVGGSRIYTGSVIFNALGALKVGVDLVYIVAQQRVADIAAGFLPDIIARPLDKDLELKHTEKIIKLSKKFDSLIIGSGLARNPKTYQAVRILLKNIAIPKAIDAEAIRALAEKEKILNKLDLSKAILTPNSKEFEILTKEKLSTDLKERKEKVQKWAQKLKTVILLKGHIDVISDGKEVYLNKTGSSFMTKGGFGDLLAGICGGLLALGVDNFEAAKLAAYINGKAGKLAAKKRKQSVLASDSFDYINEVIKNL